MRLLDYDVLIFDLCSLTAVRSDLLDLWVPTRPPFGVSDLSKSRAFVMPGKVPGFQVAALLYLVPQCIGIARNIPIFRNLCSPTMSGQIK